MATPPADNLFQQYYNGRQVAALVGLSPSTLKNFRLNHPDKSPPFVRIGGSVRYPLNGPGGLHAWLAARSAADGETSR
jgi:predicted DNA-binding transcriptional regulator AlpA